jgi:hypothetical protein
MDYLSMEFDSYEVIAKWGYRFRLFSELAPVRHSREDGNDDLSRVSIRKNIPVGRFAIASAS